MLSLGLSLDIETETEKVSVSVSILRLRKVKSRSRQRDWQSAYTGLGLETPTLVSLIPVPCPLGCRNMQQWDHSCWLVSLAEVEINTERTFETLLPAFLVFWFQEEVQGDQLYVTECSQGIWVILLWSHGSSLNKPTNLFSWASPTDTPGVNWETCFGYPASLLDGSCH